MCWFSKVESSCELDMTGLELVMDGSSIKLLRTMLWSFNNEVTSFPINKMKFTSFLINKMKVTGLEEGFCWLNIGKVMEVRWLS